jgi:CO dehydrogenase/acetyl-CoA synthase alpha subunit
VRARAHGSPGRLRAPALAWPRIDQDALAVARGGDLAGIPAELSNQAAATADANGMAPTRP